MAKGKVSAKTRRGNSSTRKAADRYQAKHHLVTQFSASVRSGAYRRLPEFQGLTLQISQEQIERLETRLCAKLHPTSGEIISGVFLSTIEDATIRLRAPSTKDIENAFTRIASDTIEILGSLSNLKSRITFPGVGFGDPIDSSQRQQILTAEQIAAQYLARKVETPELYLDLVPLVSACYTACHVLKPTGPGSGPSGELWFTLTLLWLLEAADLAGAKVTLPPNSNPEVHTVFFSFVREALIILVEFTEQILEFVASPGEKQEILTHIDNFKLVSDRGLLNRLRRVKRLKGKDMEEVLRIFELEANAKEEKTPRPPSVGSHQGSTRGRLKSKIQKPGRRST